MELKEGGAHSNPNRIIGRIRYMELKVALYSSHILASLSRIRYMELKVIVLSSKQKLYGLSESVTWS